MQYLYHIKKDMDFREPPDPCTDISTPVLEIRIYLDMNIYIYWHIRTGWFWVKPKYTFDFLLLSIFYLFQVFIYLYLWMVSENLKLKLILLLGFPPNPVAHCEPCTNATHKHITGSITRKHPREGLFAVSSPSDWRGSCWFIRKAVHDVQTHSIHRCVHVHLCAGIPVCALSSARATMCKYVPARHMYV